MQWSSWSTDGCDAEPGPAPDQVRTRSAVDTDAGVVPLGELSTSAWRDATGHRACANVAVEVYALEPVRLAVQCDPGVDVIVGYTLSPWAERTTTASLFEDGVVVELPYLGSGPYHTARLTLSRADEQLGPATCQVFAASQSALLD